jgi:hypothetical protein
VSKKLPDVKADDRRMRRARLIRDGMSWRQACLQSGYSPATANRGPRGYIENEPAVQKDFERAAEEAVWKPEQLKRIVTHRLATAVIEGKPSTVAREAELIGRMKDVDLFVRNADVQVGVFGLLATPEAGQMLDALNKAIDDNETHL